jgi:hypothetical protein
MHAAGPVAFVTQVDQAISISCKTAFTLRPLHSQRLRFSDSRKVRSPESVQHIVGFLPAGKNPAAWKAGFAADKQGSGRMIQRMSQIAESGCFIRRVQAQSNENVEAGMIVPVA